VESWRLRIVHKSGFDYAGPVSSSYNEARMWPRNEARQAVLDARVEVWPPARTYRYEDYWGTVVTAFDVHAKHEALTVTATSTVETLPPGDLVGDGASWEDLAVPESVDRWYELLLPSKRTTLNDELTGIAADIRAAHATPHTAALAVCEFVRGEVTYQTGATGVQSDALHAWEQRKGVCQDISHLTVGMLRSMGLPARYVSGYLHPRPSAAIGRVWSARATPGWSGGWAGGPPSTRPTGYRSASGTWWSAGDANTATCRR
jgi:transglutaminase-like putative cysteine protease